MQSNDYQDCVNVLRRGGIVLCATDTVWGISCDANNSEAVQKVKELKQRSEGKSFIVVAPNVEILKESAEVNEGEESLLLEGERPTTVILKLDKGVTPGVFAEDGTVGVRIPKSGEIKALIELFGGLLVSTSANISGEPTPIGFNDLNPRILKGVDYVLNLQGCGNPQGIPVSPSRVVKVAESGEIIVLRG